MAENNATCSICGNGYHLCLSCRDSIQLAPYKVYCCSADCYKVFQVIRGFSTGVYTNEDFVSKLENMDLNNLENYREHIKAIIKKALKKEEKPAAKTIEKTEVVKPIVAEDRKRFAGESIKDTMKPTVSYKKNYKA